MKDRSNFQKANIDTTASKTPAVNNGDPPIVDQNKKWTEQERVKQELTIEQKQYSSYK